MTRIEPDEARQGPKGKPVLKVLIAALALCAVVFVGLGLYGWAMPDDTLSVPASQSGITAPPGQPTPNQAN